MSAATTASRRPALHWPRTLAALQVRNYRLYLSSQVVATTGLWMQRIAQDWLVLELTGSITAVGIAVALQFLPVLLFGLIGGVIADRFPKRRILLVTQSVAASMALTLGVLALTGTVQAWHVFVVATMLGFVTAVDNPTRQVFVSELVGPRHLRNAVSLNASVFQFGALLGPALSGLLIHAVGQGWSFMINFAACVLVITITAILRVPAAPADRAIRAKGQLREGLSYIRSTSEVAWTIVLVATVGIFGLNMPVILAAFADHEFGTGVAGYSVFNSLTAVGALAGAILSARRTDTLRLRTLVSILTGLGVVLALVSIAPTSWLFGAMLVGCGLLTLLFLTGANSLVQTRSDPAVRGRVMSVYILVLLGGQAIGGPAVGWLIDHFGARPSMFLCGGLVALIAVITGLAIARHARLGLEVDLRREHGRSPVHIVQHPQRGLESNTRSAEYPTRAPTPEHDRDRDCGRQDHPARPAQQTGGRGVRRRARQREQHRHPRRSVHRAVRQCGDVDVPGSAAQPVEQSRQQSGEHDHEQQRQRRRQSRIVVSEQYQRRVPQAPGHPGDADAEPDRPVGQTVVEIDPPADLLAERGHRVAHRTDQYLHQT
ncbi:MAG: MFS transporter [Microlunatus sp.]|nr:MFS transporter [Microlunatus sp.]